MYFVPSKCQGGSFFTSSIRKARDVLNGLSTMPNVLRIALEVHFGLMELISQWKSNEDKKEYIIQDWVSASSLTKAETANILDRPLVGFRCGTSISTGRVYCSQMKRLESIALKVEKDVPEGVFSVGPFLSCRSSSVVRLPPLEKVTEVAASSHAGASVAVQDVDVAGLVDEPSKSIDNSVPTITNVIAVSLPSTNINIGTATSSSSTATTAVSSVCYTQLNGNSEKLAKEGCLAKEARRMALTMQSMYSVRPESDLGKRKFDEACMDLGQKMEKCRKIEGRVSGLLQEYRRAREELVRASGDVREAFQKVNSLAEVDMADYPLL